jgi:GxxExxY protein
MDINDISGSVVDAAMKVHSLVGPGLIESVYEACLAHELRRRGFDVQVQLPLALTYEGMVIHAAYRIDLLVADRVVVELKAVDTMRPVYKSQLLSYLRLSGHRVGLLINFHVPHLRDGIERVVDRF